MVNSPAIVAGHCGKGRVIVQQPASGADERIGRIHPTRRCVGHQPDELIVLCLHAMNHLVCSLAWIVLMFAAVRGVAAEPWDPTLDYHERQIEGWRVLVNQKLDCDEQKKLCDETLKLLGDHLYRISRVVPAGALAKLRRVPIWVERAHPQHKCMCYHPSPVWLREHG